MSSSSYRFDDRDMAVIEQLEPGDRLTVTKLESLYRRYTDVRRHRTMRRRVKDLLTQPEFERGDGPYWTFTGLDD